MSIFHRHNYKIIVKRSNVIQFDDMGYPLRLDIVQCKCGKCEQIWVDTYEKPNDVVLKWNAP